MTATRHLGTGLLVLTLLGVVGCGEQTPASVTASVDGDRAAAGAPSSPASEGSPTPSRTLDVVRLAAGQPEPRLDCRRGDRSTMVLDFAHGAEGSPTPEEAVGPRSVEDGERLVVSRTGSTAWVVGADGTARSEVDLLRHRGGWLVHQRTSCG